MEPQMIDYYNEEPQMMKIIEKMNEELEEVQKENEKVKKEYEKVKKELEDYHNSIREFGRQWWAATKGDVPYPLDDP